MATAPNNQQPYFATNGFDKGVPNLPLDAQWARGSFLIPNDLLDNSISSNTVLEQIAQADFSSVSTTDIKKLKSNLTLFYRYWTSAYLKWTNTQLGGNIGVNSKPQFTRYADIRVPGLIYNNKVTVPVFGKNGELSPNAINIGMGRYYSEAIDDKAQRVYMRFGVPMFNTLANFLNNVFNTNLADLANTGRGPSAFYYAGWTLGKVSMFTTFPVAALLLTGVQAATRVANALGFSQFYTMKPTMPLYWSAVNDLVNQMATYRGILPPGILSNTFNFKYPSTYGNNGGNDADIAAYNKLLPTLYTSSGALNVFAIATRAQIMYDAARRELEKAENGASISELTPQFYAAKVKSAVTKAGQSVGPDSLSKLINSYKKYVGTNAPTPPVKGNAKAATNKSADKIPDWIEAGLGDIEAFFYVDPKNSKYDPQSSNKFFNYLKAEAQDGGGFAVFVVDGSGHPSESFSNDVGTTDIAGILNNAESAERQFKFSAEGGNLGGMAAPIQAILSNVKSTLAGVASGIGIGGIANFLFGKGMIEIPKFWTGSSASLPKCDYKFSLISPYGNPISQLQNIYLPLAMLLVGGLPLATGKQSYTSPFLCQVFDRGQAEIQLGLIDSISITRGTSNLAFTQEWRMLACEVNVSIVDLSNVMFMPLTSGSFFNVLAKAAGAKASQITMGLAGSTNTLVDGAIQAAAGTLELAATDENSVLYNYLLILTGASAQDALYNVSKARLALANAFKYESELSSPAFWANRVYGWSSAAWGVGALTRLYAGFSVNADLLLPADAANPKYITAQSALTTPLN
jgi:hypothetical protein